MQREQFTQSQAGRNQIYEKSSLIFSQRCFTMKQLFQEKQSQH